MQVGQTITHDLATAKDQLRTDGWCVLNDVLSHGETAEALNRLWAAARESERRGVPTFMPVLDPNASNVRVFGLLDIDPLFRQLIRHPTALELVRSLLGEDFLISNFTANIARPLDAGAFRSGAGRSGALGKSMGDEYHLVPE